MTRNFNEWLNETQLNEATTRGKAVISVVDKKPYEMEATIVHKTDGYAPNIQLDLKWHTDKQTGQLVTMMDVSKGSFEDKKNFKKFVFESNKILESLDDLETYLMTGRTKQAEKLLKQLGAKVEIAQ